MRLKRFADKNRSKLCVPARIAFLPRANSLGDDREAIAAGAGPPIAEQYWLLGGWFEVGVQRLKGGLADGNNGVVIQGTAPST